ncbi:MAG: ABC transporter ATP-binding protein [Anaerolineae bacterium]|nr:MAG: ABC transporter ATP-binding protein [Anaerolineae bacterium]
MTFDLPQGAIGALLGPSGGGKSTLLEIIAGLQAPDSGEVRWQGRSLLGVPPHRRGVGMVFQDYALFPHLNVFDNVAFGLRMARRPVEEVRRRVHEALELVGLRGFERRSVTTLSGGEQQRVALARALAPRPSLLLLDEPLGALDRALRDRLLVDLRRILRGLHQTALYVTHDQEEAFTLADRVILLREGQVAQQGTPRELYHAPASAFVARFLGMENIFEGQVHTREGRLVVQTPFGVWPYPQDAAPASGRVRFLLRPDGFTLSSGASVSLQGIVREVSFRGARQRALVEVAGQRIQADFGTRQALPVAGTPITLGFEPETAFQVLEG